MSDDVRDLVVLSDEKHGAGGFLEVRGFLREVTPFGAIS